MTRSLKLVIGTRKGLFLAITDPGRKHFRWSGPLIAGYEIQSALLDPREPEIGYALAHHKVWGSHVYRTADGGLNWNPLDDVPRHQRDEGPASLKMLWSIGMGHASQPGTLYVGIEPPGLFVSTQRGVDWQSLEGFQDQPSAKLWAPAKGGLALHSVANDPERPQTLYAALAAGGVYRSDDMGQHWKPVNQGVRAPYLNEAAPVAGQCIHRLYVHPAGGGRLYQQSHSGTYVSRDHGDNWQEISSGLPSDFGYALVGDPNDVDTLYVVPEQSSQLRAVADARLRVYRSRDAGKNWAVCQRGLPQDNVYVTILREGLEADGLDPPGLYLGTTSGHLFASLNGGASWELLAGYLPGILSVRATLC
ncbi:MAG: WD40/YVTN/BNR-like repeat-containing protein [Gammaproteobacteria bacterium]